MEILIDGNRSSTENWMLAQSASREILPSLSDAEKTVADQLRTSHETYARGVYAGDLTRSELAAKADCAARFVERMAQRKAPGVVLDSVWLKTMAGKFRFELNLNRSHAAIWVDEDVVDQLLESGSQAAEEQIARIIDCSLPASWTAKAS